MERCSSSAEGVPENELKTVQQFNLKWNNHTSNILQVFSEQLACEALVDVTLSCQGHFLKAHKMILSACSPFFQELFQIHDVVSHPIIIMNGMKFSDVQHVVDFMYRGEVKVVETDLERILAVAEQLQIKGLCNVRCENRKENGREERPSDSPSSYSVNAAASSEPRSKKRRRIEHHTNASDNSSLSLEHGGLETMDIKDEDDLSENINVNPPQITDIDDPNASNNDSNTVNCISNTQMTIAQNQTHVKQTEVRQTSSNVKTYSRSPKQLSQQNHHNQPSTTRQMLPKRQQNNNSDCNRTNERPPPFKEKVPRPPNAFMIFANEWRKVLAKENPKESNKDISVRLGKKWKTLTADVKENYYVAARKADEEHKIKYPGYFYSPKEARIRKNLSSQSSAANRASYVRSTMNTDGTIDAMILCKLVMPQEQSLSGAAAAPDSGGCKNLVVGASNRRRSTNNKSSDLKRAGAFGISGDFHQMKQETHECDGNASKLSALENHKET